MSRGGEFTVRIVKSMMLFLSISITSTSCNTGTDIQPYASTTPIQEPVLFAKDVITLDNATERALTFSPDGDTIYFHRRDSNSPKLYVSSYKNGEWSTPEIADFAPVDFHNESAFYSSDGQT